MTQGGGSLLASSLLCRGVEIRFYGRPQKRPQARRREEVCKMREKVNKKERTGLGIQNPGRSCVRADTGLARIPKVCIHGFECSHCGFDQWIEEMEGRVLSVQDFSIERNLLAEAA